MRKRVYSTTCQPKLVHQIQNVASFESDTILGSGRISRLGQIACPAASWWMRFSFCLAICVATTFCFVSFSTYIDHQIHSKIVGGPFELLFPDIYFAAVMQALDAACMSVHEQWFNNRFVYLLERMRARPNSNNFAWPFDVYGIHFSIPSIFLTPVRRNCMHTERLKSRLLSFAAMRTIWYSLHLCVFASACGNGAQFCVFLPYLRIHRQWNLVKTVRTSQSNELTLSRVGCAKGANFHRITHLDRAEHASCLCGWFKCWSDHSAQHQQHDTQLPVVWAIYDH